MDYTRDAVLIQDISKSRILEKESRAAGSDKNETNSQDLMTQVFVESLANMSMNDNDTDEYVPYVQRPETYIVPVLFAIIFIIGVLGNGTLIAIFIKHRNMRNVPNMYICSLAVGDILVILFCVPFTSTVYTVESWPYGLIVCKFSEFIKDVSIGVSVFTLTALSADRYFAISDPMRKLTGRRATKITCVTIIGIWILSIVIALPSGLFSFIKVITVPEQSRIFHVCYPFPTDVLGPRYPQIMVMCKFLVYYAIPLGFIATFYIVMARHLVLSTRNMPGEAQGTVKQIQARKKVAKMVLSFVVIFAMCFFPSHVFLLWFYFNPESEFNYNAFWHVLRILGFCLGFINSCINPITLYCVSGTFRKHFNQHLFCCLCDNDGHIRNTNHRGGGGVGVRGFMGCGCVSISNTGPVFAEGQRPRNVRGLNGLFRASTTNSGGKRKNTWDTQQSTISHHQLIMGNLNAGTAANSAYIRTLNNPPNGNGPHIQLNSFPLTHHIQHHNQNQRYRKQQQPPLHLDLPPQVLVTNCVDTHCSKSDSVAPDEIQPPPSPPVPLAQEESM